MYEILDFIHRRFSIDANWLNGNCYWFAHILSTRFPYLKIYYLPIIGHFVCGDGVNFFDWTGLIVPEETPFLLTDIEKQDILWYNKIVRDCIM